MINHLIILLEIIFVGMRFRNGRKEKMFYVDAFFWLTIGWILTFFVTKSFLSGDALFFVIGKTMINALFNVLIADMLLAYFSFYKFHRKSNKNHVSIHQFLSHITFMSILIPIFLNVAINVWNMRDYIQHDVLNRSIETANRVENEMKHLSKNELLMAEVRQSEKLENLIRQNSSGNFKLTITNKDHQILAPKVSQQGNFLTHTQHYNINKVSTNFYVALSKEHSNRPTILTWNAGQYVYIKELKHLDLKIVIQYPIFQYQKRIYTNFLDQLKLSLIFALVTIVLVKIVSHKFTVNLRELTDITTGLPKKILTNENVTWSESHISELRLLTNNLMKMADKIKQLFQESAHMNRKLSKQTEKLKKSEDQLHELAYYDVLTKLPNRLHFQQYVRNLIQQKRENPFAILFIDINQFKQINGTLGHDAGDTLLKMAATKLSDIRNNEKEVFRLGGDEFVIVHCFDDKSELMSTVNSVLDKFNDSISVLNQMFYVTVSVGVSVYPIDGNNLDTLVKSADLAMYKSKAIGGNVAQFFDETMRDKFQRRVEIENRLRVAVELGTFEQYYQPKVRDRQVVSMEALIRWYDQTLGLISPGYFIPIAEEMGLVTKIDEWSLNQACRQIKRWQDLGYRKIPVSVNISAKFFQQDSLIELVKKTLRETELEPRYLKLEITESVFIQKPKRVAKVIDHLKQLGVQISIDDFGKGYSSLYLLMQLPIDEIKIDRVFIQNIDQDEKKAFIVKSICDIAHGLKLNIVAEGVETENERALLNQMGCDEIQGYLYSPPVKREEMEQLLHR